MATLARLLYDLQDLDLALAETERNIRLIRSRLGETDELKAARESLSGKQREHKDLAARLRSLELDLGELEEKIAGNESSLYSGTGHSPKELASLQKEVEILKNHRGQLEEETLEIMDRLEKAQKEESGLQLEYERKEAQWREGEARMQEELKGLEGRHSTLIAQRTTMLKPIAIEILATYEELRQRKGGLGVALVREGICSGCGVDVPKSQEQEIMRGEHLVHCFNCERILYVAV